MQRSTRSSLPVVVRRRGRQQRRRPAAGTSPLIIVAGARRRLRLRPQRERLLVGRLGLDRLSRARAAPRPRHRRASSPARASRDRTPARPACRCDTRMSRPGGRSFVWTSTRSESGDADRRARRRRRPCLRTTSRRTTAASRPRPRERTANDVTSRASPDAWIPTHHVWVRATGDRPPVREDASSRCTSGTGDPASGRDDRGENALALDPDASARWRMRSERCS